MRPAAEVDEFPVPVKAHFGTRLGEFRHEVRLHEVAVLVEAFQALIPWSEFMDERLVARHHLGHLLLNGRQVFGRESLLAIEVVEESRIRRRAVTQLCFRKELEHRRRHHVRGRVAHHFQRLGILLPYKCQLRIGGQRRRQVHQARRGAVFGCIHCRFCRLFASFTLLGCASERSQPGHDGDCGKARRDGVGNVKRRCAGGHFANRPVGQVDCNCLRAHDCLVPVFSGRGVFLSVTTLQDIPSNAWNRNVLWRVTAFRRIVSRSAPI